MSKAGIQASDVIAAIVCKPGYDTVKSRVVADVGQGVYGDKFFVVWNMDDVISRAEDWRDVHLTEDAALMVLDWLDNSVDANIGIDWEWIDNGIDVVLEELGIEAEIKK